MLPWTKKCLKSLTINFGLLLQVAGAVQIYAEDMGDPKLTMITGVIVILLRFKTNKPISDK